MLVVPLLPLRALSWTSGAFERLSVVGSSVCSGEPDLSSLIYRVFLGRGSPGNTPRFSGELHGFPGEPPDFARSDRPRAVWATRFARPKPYRIPSSPGCYRILPSRRRHPVVCFSDPFRRNLPLVSALPGLRSTPAGTTTPGCHVLLRPSNAADGSKRRETLVQHHVEVLQEMGAKNARALHIASIRDASAAKGPIPSL